MSATLAAASAAVAQPTRKEAREQRFNYVPGRLRGARHERGAWGSCGVWHTVLEKMDGTDCRGGSEGRRVRHVGSLGTLTG